MLIEKFNEMLKKIDNKNNIELKRISYINDIHPMKRKYINYFELIGKINEKGFLIELEKEEIEKLGLFSGKNKLIKDRIEKIIYPKLKEIDEKIKIIGDNKIQYAGTNIFEYNKEIKTPTPYGGFVFNTAFGFISNIYNKLENLEAVNDETEYLYEVKSYLDKLPQKTPVLYNKEIAEYYPLGTKEFKNLIENDIIPMLDNGTYMEQK